MQVRTRHTPSFGVARLVLAAAEPVCVRSGAMVATSYGVAAQSRPEGGVLRSFARAAFGGATPSVSTYTAPQQGGWVDVAPALPGDLHVLDLDGRAQWCLNRSCWLASSTTVRTDAGWSGFTALFGGEPGFLTHVTGTGSVVATCYGALDVLTLQPGEFVTVDPAHVVAYADTTQTRLRQVEHGSGAPNRNQSLRTGEGLVFDFAGPGRVLTQTRNPRALLSALARDGFGSR